jgi:hypothetical protein
MLSASRGLPSVVALPLLVALSFGVSSCGSSDSGTSPTSTPTKHVIDQGSFTTAVGTSFLVADQIIGSATGTAEIDVDWTFGSDDVEVGLFAGNCLTTSCPVANLLGHTSTLVKPQKLTIANVGPGTYTVVILNNGPNNESGNWQFYLTY